MKDKLSALIKDPDLEKLELELSKKNLFEILKVAHMEIRHSNFLAWLLDPKQGHNLQDKFLKLFLKDIFSENKITWADEFGVDNIKTDDVIVLREFRNIDLMIVTQGFAIVIENKVWSREHSSQLKRYGEIIRSEFPKKEIAFVFLTPWGDDPEDQSDADIYISYNYANILAILESILKIYGEYIVEKSREYIEDYIKIIRRYIMKEDEVIEIARSIYTNHKEALEFIFENKKDRMLEVSDIFVKAIEAAGYVPETQNKGYARFLTPKLHEVIPRDGTSGWKGGEAFLFEMGYSEKGTRFKCVISPGNERRRSLIKDALMNVKGAKDRKSLQWSTVHSHLYRGLKVLDEKFEDDETLKKAIIKMLEDEREFIQKVEEEILKVVGDL